MLFSPIHFEYLPVVFFVYEYLPSFYHTVYTKFLVVIFSPIYFSPLTCGRIYFLMHVFLVYMAVCLSRFTSTLRPDQDVVVSTIKQPPPRQLSNSLSHHTDETKKRSTAQLCYYSLFYEQCFFCCCGRSDCYCCCCCRR